MPKHESYRSRVHDSSTPYFTREREDHDSSHRAHRREESARRALDEFLEEDEDWGLFDNQR